MCKYSCVSISSYFSDWWLFTSYKQIEFSDLISALWNTQNSLSWSVFEPAQLPQEMICPSAAFAKGQIGNCRGQSVLI